MTPSSPSADRRTVRRGAGRGGEAGGDAEPADGRAGGRAAAAAAGEPAEAAPARGRRQVDGEVEGVGQPEGTRARALGGAAAGGDAAPRPSLGEAVARVFRGVVGLGWPNLLEIVLLSLLWFVCALSAALIPLASQVVAKGGGLLIGLVMWLLPLALLGPGSIGLFRGMDAIWSGEAGGPLDALRNFFRGFGHRWWRGVGLSAVWVLLGLATYAHLIEDRRLLPNFLFLGVDILLLYLILFALMVNTYLLGILATTELALLPAIRIGAWQAVANPIFTLILIFAPGVVVLVALAIHALFPTLVGGAMAMFATGALRHAPYRHPSLPPPVDYLSPVDDDAAAG